MVMLMAVRNLARGNAAMRIPVAGTFRYASLRHASTGTYNTTKIDGLRVASCDDGGRTSAVALVARAGSRFEPIPGASFLLEKFAFKSTTNKSTQRICRELELLGAKTKSLVSRENIILMAQFLREDLPYFVNLFADMAANTRFKDFELAEEVLPLAKYEYSLQQKNADIVGIDLIHNAAFRRGLGSLLDRQRLTSVTEENSKEFASSSYTKNNIGLIATGVEQVQFENAVKSEFSSLPLGSTAISATSKYFGGEVRQQFCGSMGSYFIAFDSSNLDSATQSVMRALFGSKSRIKWSHGNSLLAQAINEFDHRVVASCNSYSYSDASLLVFHVIGPQNLVGKAASTIMAKVRNSISVLTSTDLKRAIAQAKFDALATNEKCVSSIESVASQLFSDTRLIGASDAVKAFDNVSLAELKKSLEQVLSTKPSVAVLGDLTEIPYFDEL